MLVHHRMVGSARKYLGRVEVIERGEQADYIDFENATMESPNLGHDLPHGFKNFPGCRVDPPEFLRDWLLID